jgi:hypothetical protein
VIAKVPNRPPKRGHFKSRDIVSDTVSFVRIEGGLAAAALAAHAADQPIIRLPPIANARPRDLVFDVDIPARRVTVTVVDRNMGSVLRSFVIVMPGGTGYEAPRRGALVDATA